MDAISFKHLARDVFGFLVSMRRNRNIGAPADNRSSSAKLGELMIRRGITEIGLLLMLGSGASVPSARADDFAAPWTYIQTSPLKKACFVMVPPTNDAQGRRATHGSGVAYLIGQKGNFEKKWETTGWFSESVLISEDAACLICVNQDHVGEIPRSADVALVFYKKGKKLSQFAVTDLMKSPERVHKTVTRYRWLALGIENLSLLGSELRLITADGWHYTFDTTRGELTGRREVELPSSAQRP